MGIYCSPWDRNSPLYGTPAYVEMYRKQLQELYSHYGNLFTSWHDGANGGDGYYGNARETRKIDRATYYDWPATWAITRKIQPEAVIFGDVGPDIRWVGNEEGHAGETCWATYEPQAPEEGKSRPMVLRNMNWALKAPGTASTGCPQNVMSHFARAGFIMPAKTAK
uniref:Alpha-L-fucosidase n=1 Tax=Chryseobacterium endophyticum TaxID=1854762 RepID=A0AAU6WLH1_9FLAO